MCFPAAAASAVVAGDVAEDVADTAASAVIACTAGVAAAAAGESWESLLFSSPCSSSWAVCLTLHDH